MQGNPIPTRRGARLASLAIVAMTVLAGGCSSQDPAGIRIVVGAGGKGTMTVAALTTPDISTIQPTASKGVKWTDGAQLTITVGDFESIDDVSFEDLVVDAADFAADGGTVRMVIPRGNDARWYHALHVSAKKRAAMQKALDQTIQKVELNENLTIAVEITGASVAAHLVQTVPGVSVTAKRGVSMIVIPMDVLEKSGSPMVLAINWERPGTTASRP